LPEPWKGEGPGVLEIVEDHGNTFRAVYTIPFAEAVYVLLAFQKKSPRGSRQPAGMWSWFSERLKVRLAYAINQILERRRLPQAEAARHPGINQPKVSALANCRLEGFSVERLMHFLNALGWDVEIVIRGKPRSRRAARTFVTSA
jgi:predicted XRE-type DNA-binding protein